MRGGTNQFDPFLRLAVWVRTDKGRQEWVVNIDNFHVPGGGKFSGQNLHIARQHQQITVFLRLNLGFACTCCLCSQRHDEMARKFFFFFYATVWRKSWWLLTTQVISQSRLPLLPARYSKSNAAWSYLDTKNRHFYVYCCQNSFHSIWYMRATVCSKPPFILSMILSKSLIAISKTHKILTAF